MQYIVNTLIVNRKHGRGREGGGGTLLKLDRKS